MSPRPPARVVTFTVDERALLGVEDDSVFETSEAVDFERNDIAGSEPLVVRDFRAIQLEETSRSAGTRADHVARIQRDSVARAFENLREGPRHVLHVAARNLHAVDEGAHLHVERRAIWRRFGLRTKLVHRDQIRTKRSREILSL